MCRKRFVCGVFDLRRLTFTRVAVDPTPCIRAGGLAPARLPMAIHSTVGEDLPIMADIIGPLSRIHVGKK